MLTSSYTYCREAKVSADCPIDPLFDIIIKIGKSYENKIAEENFPGKSKDKAEKIFNGSLGNLLALIINENDQYSFDNIIKWLEINNEQIDNIENGKGGTIFTTALKKYAVNPHYAQSLIKILDTEQLLAGDKQGTNPLMIAARYDYDDIAKTIIDKLTPEQINIGDKSSQTALMYAAIYNSYKVAALILEKISSEQANVGTTKIAKTALMFAAGSRSEKTASLIYKKLSKEQRNVCDTEGESALFYAVRSNSAPIVELLISEMTEEEIRRLYNIRGKNLYYYSNNEEVYDLLNTKN